MSRLTLRWFNLTQREGQDLCLKIPICDVYAPIIDRAFPELNHIGYQSGASAWSLARFLKSRGALQVYGLACVQSWRDTDNQ